MYNKTLFGARKGGFPAPLLLTSVQFAMQWMLAGLILEYVTPSLRPKRAIDWNAFSRHVAPVGVAMGFDIGLSNLSLVHVTVSFYTLAKTSSKYKKKTKGEIIRENMPDKLMPRLIKWIQHLFTTFGRDVVIVMCMVYVMQGARTAFLYLAIDYACMDPNVGLGVSAGQAAVSAQPFAL